VKREKEKMGRESKTKTRSNFEIEKKVLTILLTRETKTPLLIRIKLPN
jgi:hypothetical protein